MSFSELYFDELYDTQVYLNYIIYINYYLQIVVFILFKLDTNFYFLIHIVIQINIHIC